MTQKAAAAKSTESRNNIPPSRAGKTKIHSQSSLCVQILHLQRTLGNAAVQRLYETGQLQAKLTIGQPNDRYERGADSVANRVMSMPDPQIRSKPT